MNRQNSTASRATELLLLSRETTFSSDDLPPSDGAYDHDHIEVLSSEIIFLEPTILVPVQPVPHKKIEVVKKQEKSRKRASHFVTVVSILLFLFCIVLISVSFIIATDIDEIVRNSNELLKKHPGRSNSHIPTPTPVRPERLNLTAS